MRLFALGKIVEDFWRQIPTHFHNVEVELFVVMPNHIHGIITILEDRRGTIYCAPTIEGKSICENLERFGKPIASSLPTIIRTYKAAVTRYATHKLLMNNIWQRNYYEHIIRNQAEMEKIALYILTNPQA
jgi:REP element-mobilizing transposase RayT